MTILKLIIGLSLPLLTGFCLLDWLWPERDGRSVLLKIFLAPAAGLALASILYFFGLLVFGRLGVELKIAELLLAALAVALDRRFNRKRWRVKLSWSWSTLLFVLILAGSLVAFFLLAAGKPDGDWDAWAIWNLKARFLYLGGGAWRTIFDPFLSASHPDYPLFLPLNVARLMSWMGQTSVWAPIGLAGTYLMSTLGLLAAALLLVRSRAVALTGALVLLATPYFFHHSYSQYADLPLSYFYLAAAVSYILYERSPRPALLGLCGFWLGVSATIKNEGAIFALVFVLVIFVREFFLSRRNRRLEKIGWLVAGLVLPAAVSVIFRAISKAPSDFLGIPPAEIVKKLRDPSRYLLIARALKEKLAHFGATRVSPLWPLLGYWYFAAPRSSVAAPAAGREKGRKIQLTLGAVLVLTALAYILAYLITPYDLAWQLETTVWRLTFQLYPLFLLIVLCDSSHTKQSSS